MFNRNRIKVLEKRAGRLNTSVGQITCKHDRVFRENHNWVPSCEGGPVRMGYWEECIWCGKILQTYSMRAEWLEARLEYIKQIQEEYDKETGKMTKDRITKERREFLMPTSEKDNAKWYRHREDRYEVQAYPSNCSELECYTVLGYGDGGKMYGRNAFIRLVVSDFEKLFEPVSEYCCGTLERMVKTGVFFRGSDGQWFLKFTYNKCRGSIAIYACPFCEKKLEGSN